MNDVRMFVHDVYDMCVCMSMMCVYYACVCSYVHDVCVCVCVRCVHVYT